MQKDLLVNIGRVVLVNYGPLSGKLAVIVDLVNASRVVIDGPGLGVKRTVISNKRISLTPFSLSNVAAQISGKDLEQAITAFNLRERFDRSGLGSKIKKQERRAALTDFERFKVYTLKKQLGRALRTRVNASKTELRAAAKKLRK